MSFALNAFLSIFLHLAPDLAGMSWSIYQQQHPAVVHARRAITGIPTKLCEQTKLT